MSWDYYKEYQKDQSYEWKIKYVKAHFKDKKIGVGQLIRHLSEQGVPVLSLSTEEIIELLEKEYENN